MQRRGFGRGDQIGGAARPCRLRDLHLARRAQRRGERVDGGEGLPLAALAEIAAGDRDGEPVNALVDLRRRVEEGALHLLRVGGVVGLQRIEGERQVEGRARDRSEMIEAGAEGEAAGPRQAAEGRLQAVEAAEGGGHPDRAVGVGAERGGHHAGGYRRARAARRAARHAGEIVRVERGAVMGVLAGEIIGVFAHVEPAEQHRAGRLHAVDQEGVGLCRRIVAVDLRAGPRRHALDVEEVLDRVGHAGQRQRLAGGDGRIDRVGLGQGAVEGRVGEGAELRVGRLDLGDGRFGDGARGHAACVHRRRDLVGGS